MNLVALHGYLSAAPKFTETGKGRASFSVGVRDEREPHNREKVLWVNVVAFGPLAKVCQKYLIKGSSVAITGRLNRSAWTDKNGVKHSDLEVFLDKLEFTGKKPGKDEESEPDVEW
jgi:single-strand DNA-binding protein